MRQQDALLVHGEADDDLEVVGPAVPVVPDLRQCAVGSLEVDRGEVDVDPLSGEAELRVDGGVGLPLDGRDGRVGEVSEGADQGLALDAGDRDAEEEREGGPAEPGGRLLPGARFTVPVDGEDFQSRWERETTALRGMASDDGIEADTSPEGVECGDLAEVEGVLDLDETRRSEGEVVAEAGEEGVEGGEDGGIVESSDLLDEMLSTFEREVVESTEVEEALLADRGATADRSGYKPVVVAAVGTAFEVNV